MSDEERLRRLAEDPSTIRTVNAILSNAIHLGMTEVQIEPEGERLAVRFLNGGEVNRRITPPKKMHEALVACFKIMAEMDLKCQDTRERSLKVLIKPGDERTFRIQFEPTPFGEKVTIRLA